MQFVSLHSLVDMSSGRVSYGLRDDESDEVVFDGVNLGSNIENKLFIMLSTMIYAPSI